MASENKTPPPVKAPSLSDNQARDHFIAVALRELVADQIANNKYNVDMAAAWAVRYANAVMAVRGVETAPLKVVVAKGVVAPPAPVVPPEPPAPTEPPKSIAEIIGEAEPLAEVK